MRWHIVSQTSAPYSCEVFYKITQECSKIFSSKYKEASQLKQKLSYQDYISTDLLIQDELLASLEDFNWEEVRNAIDNLFIIPDCGEFDWEDECTRYYNHFENMASYLKCILESDSGSALAEFDVKFSDDFKFQGDKLYTSFPCFYCGNGEKEGTELALCIIENYMRNHQWNIGFYDENNVLITDIPLWSKSNTLTIDTIRPIIWFGPKNHVFKVWSISTDTSDVFLKDFWTEYYGGALNYICKADSGLEMYYTICEYGIEYDDMLFEKIRESCPINLNYKKEDRISSLYNLVISIYNDSKSY